MRAGGGRAEGLKFRLLTHSLVAPWWVDHIYLGCSYFHLPLEFHSLVIKVLDWKLVDDIQTVLQVSTSRIYILWYQIMTEHEYWLLFPITVTLTLTTKSTRPNNVWPPKWDRSYKNSTTELVHSRYFVLCATFPRAEVWNPLVEHEPLLPVEMSFLWLVMGTTATMVPRKSPWHAVMSWHQQKPKDMETSEKKLSSHRSCHKKFCWVFFELAIPMHFKHDLT